MYRRYRYALAMAALLLVSGAVWLSSEGFCGTYYSGEFVSQARPVPTAQVRAMPKMMRRTFPARVRAGRRVQLGFSVSGVLVELNAAQGKPFKKGELIAKLDQRDFVNALAVAQANFVDARQNYARNKTLRDKKIIAEATYDAAKAAYDAAEAELSIKKKALEDTELHAPFDGVIAERFVENYEHINAKQEIVSFQNISNIEAVLQVPERLVARVGADGLKNVQVKFDSDGGKWYDASVSEFSMQADDITRSYDLVLKMKPPKGIKVYTGMTATVRADITYEKLSQNWNPGITLVPLKAVGEDPDKKPFVWVIPDKPGKPQKVYVKLGTMRAEGVEILSGLKSGMRVATAGLYSLTPEIDVRPMREGGEGLDG